MQRLEMAAVAAGVPLSQLMDNAGAAVAQEVERRCRPVGGKRAVVLCGKGNNGGDGFVCAKLLAQRGMACWVVLAQGKPATDLAAAAFEALPPQVAVLPGEELEQIRPVLEAADVLIDCVFGFSFRGGALRPAPKAAGLWQRPALPEGLRRPAQRRGVRHGPGVRRGVPCGRDGHVYREKASQCFLPRQGVLRGDRGAASGGARRPCGGAETHIFETDAGFPPACFSTPDPPGQQGGQREAADGLRQLGHGGGLCHGGPGSSALSGWGCCEIAGGGTALPPHRPSRCPRRCYIILDLGDRREESEERLLKPLRGCSCLPGGLRPGDGL